MTTHHLLFYVAICQIHESSDAHASEQEPRQEPVEILASHFHRENVRQGMLFEEEATRSDTSHRQKDSFRIDSTHFEKYAKYKLKALTNCHQHVRRRILGGNMKTPLFHS